MTRFIFVTAAILMLLACGGESAPEPTVEPEPGSHDAVNEEDGDAPQIPEEPVEEPVVLYPEGTLDPETIQPGQLVSSDALYAAFFAWEGKEVTIAAYPDIWYGDSAEVEDELGLVTDPESNDELVTANFEEIPEMYVHRGELIAVRGTVESGWRGPELNDAVIVEAPENLDHIEISPWIYQDQAIPADQFAELYNIWAGKEVTVEGYYSSTTTSTLDSGVIVRVDLGGAEDHYTRMAACEMADVIAEDVAEAMSGNRDGVQIRGTIAGESFNAVGLENCEIINR